MKIFRHTASILPLILLLAFTSCLTTKPPEFERAEHITAGKNNNEPQLSFDIVGHNPNNWSIKLKEFKTQVVIVDNSIAILLSDTTIRLKRGEDFSIPIRITVATKDLQSLLPSIAAMLLLKENVPVLISGEVIVKKFLFRKKFSFQFNEKIEAKMLKGIR